MPEYDPLSVEAHAAQGYPEIDVARLLGQSRKIIRDNEFISAYAIGYQRWIENGKPLPTRAIDLIIQAVHGQLCQREMTRPQLKELLGFQHDDVNLALETLHGKLMVEFEETDSATYYRATGTRSLIAEARKASMPVVIRTVEEIAVSSPAEPVELEPAPEPNGESKLSARRSSDGEEADLVAKLPPDLEAVRREADRRSLQKRRMQLPEPVVEEFPQDTLGHLAKAGRLLHEETVKEIVATLDREERDVDEPGSGLKPLPRLSLTIQEIIQLVTAGIRYGALAKRLDVSSATLSRWRKETELGPIIEGAVEEWAKSGRPPFTEPGQPPSRANGHGHADFPGVLAVAKKELEELTVEADALTTRQTEIADRVEKLTKAIAALEPLV